MQRPNTEQDRVRLLARLRSSFFLPPLIEHKYQIQQVIGEGSYGVVCSARNRDTNDLVAVKRIINVLEEAPEATRTLRELKFLRLLSGHENIISIKDVLLPGERDRFNDVFLVLELMPTDLSRVLRANIPLSNDHIRWLMYQLLRGIAYLHSARVFHRDLKPSNIMINAACDLRIIDFGLARLPQSIQPDAPLLTDYVATRWYRAPELIVLGASHYTTAIDMWSVGVIFGEMLNNGQPLFPGINNQNQIERIMSLCRSPPSESMRSAMANSSLFRNITHRPSNNSRPPLQDLIPNADPQAIDLLEHILQLDPERRISAANAMAHPYFASLHEPSAIITRDPIPPEEFAFEAENLSREQLRHLFLEEILRYHPEHREAYLNGSIANGGPRALATAGQADAVRRQFDAVQGSAPAPRAWESMPSSQMTGLIGVVNSATSTITSTGDKAGNVPSQGKVKDESILPVAGRKSSEAGMNTMSIVNDEEDRDDGDTHQMRYAGMPSVESVSSAVGMQIDNGDRK